MKPTQLIAASLVTGTLVIGTAQAKESKQLAAINTLQADKSIHSNKPKEKQPEKSAPPAAQNNDEEIVDCFYLATSNHPLCEKK